VRAAQERRNDSVPEASTRRLTGRTKCRVKRRVRLTSIHGVAAVTDARKWQNSRLLTISASLNPLLKCKHVEVRPLLELTKLPGDEDDLRKQLF
jgi:hypothetical protein